MNVLETTSVGTLGPKFLSSKHPFIQYIYLKVIKTIEKSESVPRLDSKVFMELKNGISELAANLTNDGVIHVSTPCNIPYLYQNPRPYFVALQAIFEHVLSNELNKSIHSLIGIIHTPMPATPLCTTQGTISVGLIDLSIEQDNLQRFSVEARTIIIRKYLEQGADFFIVYPKEGFDGRKPDEQKIYKSELEKHPVHLIDCPLNVGALERDLIGASYIFKNNEGKKFAFSIHMTQANKPNEFDNFGLWFSEYNHSPVEDRISKILDLVHQYGTSKIKISV